MLLYLHFNRDIKELKLNECGLPIAFVVQRYECRRPAFYLQRITTASFRRIVWRRRYSESVILNFCFLWWKVSGENSWRWYELIHRHYLIRAILSTNYCFWTLQESELMNNLDLLLNILTPLDPEDLSNYHPFSKLSFVSKLLERAFQAQLLLYLTGSNMFPSVQSAFWQFFWQKLIYLHLQLYIEGKFHCWVYLIQ